MRVGGVMCCCFLVCLRRGVCGGGWVCICIYTYVCVCVGGWVGVNRQKVVGRHCLVLEPQDSGWVYILYVGGGGAFVGVGVWGGGGGRVVLKNGGVWVGVCVEEGVTLVSGGWLCAIVVHRRLALLASPVALAATINLPPHTLHRRRLIRG